MSVIITITAALAVCAGAAVTQRYAAVDMSPVQDGLIPRFFLDAPILAARDGAPCQANAHSCVDVGFPTYCCSNNNYCYVKPNGDPWCCPIGSPCDSKCPSDKYQCPSVVAVTITQSPTTGGAALTTVTSSTTSACCGRICPGTSSFRCASQFGGGCCGYGATCASDKSCIMTITASSSATGLLTPADPGCTATTQYACEDGQGCCDKVRKCTVVSGTAACAPGEATVSGVVSDLDGDGSGNGLSSGAKTGIGVGVAVVGCGIVAFFAWFCLVRRRRRRRGATTTSQRSGGASRVSGGGGGLSNIIMGGGTSEWPGRSARAMSEVTSGSRPTARRGATQDYFGPDAVTGPYTETETVASDVPASTPGRTRGVPLQAHSPSDVVAPVEIDSRGVKRGFGHDVTAVAAPEQQHTPPTTEGRFELYGSEMLSPSPPMPSPPLLTPRSVESAMSVSVMERSPIDRSPGPVPSPDPDRRR
ncbi:transcription factor C2H2 [Colletotrichum truncatum]|uniref:Transcription factor C2H2 n=1 Tax=Colletotrichum truncatum TaxID=5467 RepID=A0ACC3ZDM2_COLTU|nr:transcription factor C2H2 [Colletotrichum truncatum]KAF6794800.1 transcription factor C2H2 [Colletotrichum truncatum]